MEEILVLIDMEKEQLKLALKNLAKHQGMSLSDLASQAGIAPSTITGFMNDVPGRGHYGLSARTQNKLAEEYSEFKDMIEKPIVNTNLVNVPIIGMWESDYRVNGLELGMPSSFASNWSTDIESYSAVIRNENFFVKDQPLNSFVNREIRYYLFKNTYIDDLNKANNKQVYCKTATGNFIGYQVKDGNKFYLYNFFGERIESAGEILKASKIEWTKQN
jgi:transcriptional regulator with XRE-family HTH domain|tara:strand:+ start:345 stop:998 length:654 start_codon:yes stop_codon:yes gene_type:complete